MSNTTHKLASATTAVAVLAKPVIVDLDKLSGHQIRTKCEFDSNALGERAVAMITHVEGLKIERSRKAILSGIYLAQIKAALGHGEFGEWKQKHFGDARSRTVNKYMQLAGKFSRSSRLLLPELVGANQLSLDLTSDNEDGRALLAKLDKFVGDCGLTELMHRHGVIKQGGSRPGPVAPAVPAVAATPEQSLEEAEAAARSSGLESVETAAKALLNENLWHDLTVDNAELIDTQLKALATQFRERLLKLKHAHTA